MSKCSPHICSIVLGVYREAGCNLAAPVVTPTILGGEECTTGVPEATHFACLVWGGAGVLCLILPAGLTLTCFLPLTVAHRTHLSLLAAHSTQTKLCGVLALSSLETQARELPRELWLGQKWKEANFFLSLGAVLLYLFPHLLFSS